MASPAFAQTYPAKPIRLVVPFPPGGVTDVIARTLAQRISDAWGQPMVLDNRPGSGSNVGNEAAARSAPDGYTLLIATTSLAINVSLYPKLPLNPQTDLAPIVLLAESPNVLAVHPLVPAKSVAELIELARSKPGELNYGSSGNGATNHLGMELFKSMAKVNLAHIPYKGGAQALNDLLGGRVQALFLTPSTLMAHHKAGKVRALAVASSRRVEGLDLPTVAESGLPGFESSAWFALFAPAGTPRPVVDKLAGEANAMLRDKAVIAQFAAAGLVPAGGTTQELAALLDREIRRWTTVVRESGARVD